MIRMGLALLVFALFTGRIGASAGTDAERGPDSISSPSPCAVDQSEVDSPEWIRAIDIANSHMSRFGGYYSLLRVVLEGASANERIRVEGTKLKDLTKEYQGGGGQFRMVRSGEFVLWEHIKSSRRRDGRDPLTLISSTGGNPTLWIEVPQKNQLGIVGDVVVPMVVEEVGRLPEDPNGAPKVTAPAGRSVGVSAQPVSRFVTRLWAWLPSLVLVAMTAAIIRAARGIGRACQRLGSRWVGISVAIAAVMMVAFATSAGVDWLFSGDVAPVVFNGCFLSFVGGLQAATTASGRVGDALFEVRLSE